jgi:hypothetical protein
MIDYRKILRFYIDYVGRCGGTCFLRGDDNFSELTPEENQALNDTYNQTHQEWLDSFIKEAAR